ncbi:hypothetical protein ACWEOW_06950 [Monashia sp. NPDC004114]
MLEATYGWWSAIEAAVRWRAGLPEFLATRAEFAIDTSVSGKLVTWPGPMVG